MKTTKALRIILITSVLALVAVIALSSLSPDQQKAQKDGAKFSDARTSLPDIEIMKNAAQKARDIFKIVSTPIAQ